MTIPETRSSGLAVFKNPSINKKGVALGATPIKNQIFHFCNQSPSAAPFGHEDKSAKEAVGLLSKAIS
jgi:hypothetical protein